jgi:microcystin-dependent protein
MAVDCKIKFVEDLGWTDISSQLHREYTVDFGLFNKDFKHTRNTFKGKIPYDDEIFTKIFTTEENIDFYLTVDSVPIFKGIIKPEISQGISTNRPESIDINAIDYSDKLDVPLTDTYYYDPAVSGTTGLLVRPNLSVYLAEIVSQINTLTGETLELKSPLSYDPVVGITAIKKGDVASKVLDDLCFEYGHQYYFTLDGKIDIARWSQDTSALTATYEFSEDEQNIIDGSFMVKKGDKTADSVEIVYSSPYTVTADNGEVIYDSGELLERKVIGDYFPNNTESSVFDFIYNPAVNRDNVSVNDRTAISITPQLVSARYGDCYYGESVFFNKSFTIDPLNPPTFVDGWDIIRCDVNPSNIDLQIKLKNFVKSTITRRIVQQIKITGKAIWKNASNLTTYNYGATKSIESYKSNYIHTKEDADNLALLIKDNSLLNKIISFQSYDKTAIGQVVDLGIPSRGIGVKALIISQSYNSVDRRYSYEAVSLTGIADFLEQKINLPKGGAVDDGIIKPGTGFTETDLENLTANYIDFPGNTTGPVFGGENLAYDSKRGYYYLSITNNSTQVRNVLKSTDLKNWVTVDNLPQWYNAEDTPVKYIESLDLLVTSGFISSVADPINAVSRCVLFSTNGGLSWTRTDYTASDYHGRITYDVTSNYFFCSDYGSELAYSTDLITWTRKTGLGSPFRLYEVPGDDTFGTSGDSPSVTLYKLNGIGTPINIGSIGVNSIFKIDAENFIQYSLKVYRQKGEENIVINGPLAITTPDQYTYMVRDSESGLIVLQRWLSATSFSFRTTYDFVTFSSSLYAPTLPSNVDFIDNIYLLNNRFIKIGREKSGANYSGRICIFASPAKESNLIAGGTNLEGNLVAGNVEATGKVLENGGAVMPTGGMIPYAGRTAPPGWLLCNGSAVSRATYQNLFYTLVPIIEPFTFTVTIATPAVFTKSGHGFVGGERLRLSTTGALPTGLNTTTDYFVSYINTTTFNLTNDLGVKVNTSGSQSGVHSYTQSDWGLGDGSTTFNLPDMRETAPVGVGTRGAGVTAHDTYVQGQFKDDQVQGHEHTTNMANNTSATATSGGWTTRGTGSYGTTAMVTDGTNGTPRKGTVTRGKRLGVNYIIKT